MFSLCSVPPMVVVVVNLTGTTTHCGGAAAPPTFAGGCPPVAEPDAVLLDIVSPCVRATDLALRLNRHSPDDGPIVAEAASIARL